MKEGLKCRSCGKNPANFGRYCTKRCMYQGRQRRRQVRPNAIQLSCGSWAVVSEVDLEFLRQYGWVRTPSGYARRGASKYTSMHRTVMQRMLGRSLTPGEEVDHIDGNPLNNSRPNLRLATRSENMRNQRNRRMGITGRIGVAISPRCGYRAYLVVNYIQVSVGVFTDPDEAAWMRDQWAIELHGEFAMLNFDYV